MRSPGAVSIFAFAAGIICIIAAGLLIDGDLFASAATALVAALILFIASIANGDNSNG